MIREKLDIVLDEDMEKILAEIGELEKVRNGEVFCHYCGTPMTLGNIQVILPLSGGRFRYVCSSVECVNHIAKPKEVD